MKIVIVGPGAIGCLLAAHLSKVTNEVWLLDKDSGRADKIRKSGIKIEGVSGNWQRGVKITSNSDEIGKPNLIIICVKSYHTRLAVKSVKDILSDSTFVLTLQNGVGNIEIISEVCGHDRVIGGVTNQGATLVNIGHIRHAGKGETVIGRIDGKIPVQLRNIRELFNRGGVPTRISRDIKGLIWSKLIINVGINALTAITHLNNGRLIDFEGTRRLLSLAVSEAVKVTRRKRIKLIYDDPLSKVEAVAQATATNISSMLQDVLKHKPTEIDFINGVIVREAQSLGIPVPVNCALTDLVKTIEASYGMRVK